MSDDPSAFSAEFSKEFGAGVWISMPSTNMTTIKVTGIRSGVGYSFRVYATNVKGAGPVSPVLHVTMK